MEKTKKFFGHTVYIYSGEEDVFWTHCMHIYWRRRRRFFGHTVYIYSGEAKTFNLRFSFLI